MLKAREKQGMCGPGETGRRDDDRTDRGERGLERGEPSRPSSGYLRALDSSATEDYLLWNIPKHDQTPVPHLLLLHPAPFLVAWRARFSLFHDTSKPAVVRSFMACPTHSLSAKVNAATLETAFGPVGRRIHARSDLMTDLQPFRVCVGTGWCAGHMIACM